MSSEPVFHVALAADWASAQEAGDYRVSTLGVTLEQEGFLHGSFAHQWRDVLARYYAGVTEPLVLLTINADRLSAPVVSRMTRLSTPDATAKARRAGKFALIKPVTTSVDGR